MVSQLKKNEASLTTKDSKISSLTKKLQSLKASLAYEVAEAKKKRADEIMTAWMTDFPESKLYVDVFMSGCASFKVDVQMCFII